MKKRFIWAVLLALGFFTFLLPFFLGAYHMHADAWRMYDWVVQHSLAYWPSCFIGLLTVPLALYQLLRSYI